MSVTIPDDIVQSAQVTKDELGVEIAVMLYEQQEISITVPGTHIELSVQQV